MLKNYTFYFLIVLLNASCSAQTKLIFDTDFGGDADDLGALAMLNHFQNKKEIDLMAVLSRRFRNKQ